MELLVGELAWVNFAAFRACEECLACAEMSRFFQDTGAIVDRIKINTLTREMRGGQAVWIKQRRALAVPIMVLANGFFRIVGNPVRALTDVEIWQGWEVDCFLQLHGEKYRAFRCGKVAVGADELPGHSLSQHLGAGTLAPEMTAAAGRELRRAHEWSCETFGAAWSHGDPHSGNFIFDPGEGRARLIDFEVMHCPSLSARERHADDLLVFLQDLMGRVEAGDWLPCASAFLRGYGRAEIFPVLEKRLAPPRGLARIWWAVRTTYLPRAQMISRCRELLGILPSLTDGGNPTSQGIASDDPLLHRHAAE